MPCPAWSCVCSITNPLNIRSRDSTLGQYEGASNGTERRLAVVDRMYNGDLSENYLGSLSLLDPEVRRGCEDETTSGHGRRRQRQLYHMQGIITAPDPFRQQSCSMRQTASHFVVQANDEPSSCKWLATGAAPARLALLNPHTSSSAAAYPVPACSQIAYLVCAEPAAADARGAALDF